MSFLLNLPLADPINGVIFYAILAIAAIIILLQRKVWPLVIAALLCIIAWFLLRHWQVPWYIFLAAFVPVAALVRKPKIVTVTVGIFSLLATVGIVNMEYQTYPDIASLDPRPVAKEMSYEEFSHTKSGAAIVHVDLPGTTSHFAARQATAYIPPAYWTDHTLPVIVLLHGNPGGPDQWFGSGEAAETADQFQAANGGHSPIVIAVDATGSETANPICADSSQAKVMTYLSQDVPQAIKQKFKVNPDQRTWTVGGLSYGGTCSLQIATNRPEAYGSIIDISGEAEPTIGNHAATVKKFFAGDESAFNDQDPAHLLAHKHFSTQAIFIAGDKDTASVNALYSLSDAARNAGMKTYFSTRPGGHSFQVWRPALRESFAWAARRGGMTAIKDPFDGIGANDVRS